MSVYRLLAGSYLHKGKTYKAPCKVVSDLDLVSIGGGDKFQLVSGKATVLLKFTKKGKKKPQPELDEEEEEDDDNLHSTEGETVDIDPEDDDEEEEEAGTVDLNTMSVPQLQKYAQDSQIELGTAKTKAMIIKAIQDTLEKRTVH